MEQVNVFSSENNAVGAHARLLVCVENNADNPEKKVMSLIITLILFHFFSTFMSMSFQGGPETSAEMMMSTRR